MNPMPQHPGLAGATVSIGSGLVSFFTHSLITIQWCAGVLAIVAAIFSVASVIRHWDK